MAPALVRTAATVVAGLLVATLAGCGGDDPPEPGPEPRGIPLPGSVQDTGSITDPVMETRWLEESTGTGESTDYQESDTRSGAIVLDDVVVTYGRDLVSAIDRTTGKSAWRSDLDMEGQVICRISEPSSPDVEVLTVVFGETSRYCTRAARISTDDGHTLESYTSGEKEFSTDLFVGLVTHAGRDYVIEDYGSMSTFDDQQKPQEVWRLRGEDDIDQAVLMAGSSVVVVLTGSLVDESTQMLHGVSLEDRTEVWRHRTSDVLPARIARGGVRLHPSDGRFLLGQTRGTHHLLRLDPETGELDGRISASLPDDPTGRSDALFTDLDNQENAPETFGRVGDDVVINNTARGLSRVGMDGTIRWTFKPEMTLREGEDAFLGAGPVTEDGSQLLAVLSNGRSTDLLLLDADDGSLLGRWAVPEEYVAGFAAAPYVRLVGDEGVVLTRNLTLYGDTETFEDGADTRRPYDTGYFTFPTP